MECEPGTARVPAESDGCNVAVLSLALLLANCLAGSKAMQPPFQRREGRS